MTQKRMKYFTISLLTVILLGSIIFNSEIKTDRNQNNDSNVHFNPNFMLIPHGSITINNDSQLANIATSGDGSSGNPYIIEGWNITTTSTHGIYITCRHALLSLHYHILTVNINEN